MTSLQPLAAEMRLAFASGPFQGDAAAHDCIDCDGIRHFLKERSWHDLDEDALWKVRLPLLTKEAYHAFLPAWLWHGLHQPESAQAGIALISMEATEYVSTFTSRERELLVRCAQFIHRNDPFATQDHESIERIRGIEQRWAP